MSVSAAISYQLPMLRRFARALAGSQSSGDAYVVATLEAILESGATIDAETARRELFGAFLRIWQSVSVNIRPGAVDHRVEGPARAADRSLERMTPKPRIAFLLHALEGFSVPEIAELLRESQAEVSDLLTEAGKEIASMILTDVLIIEDEPMIAMDLEALVTELGHTVTHIARTQKEALAAIEDRRPGLVLADIHLADGSSGLDAVNDILAACSVPVIFITAYPERLLTGERPEPTFLITKPFRPEVVKAIISQALFFDRRAGAQPSSAAA
ncbi:MAG TPA: response regulator [Acetobacteraceae bacterium]|nr:response regulator [Acetobacteraceae bacterium]